VILKDRRSTPWTWTKSKELLLLLLLPLVPLQSNFLPFKLYYFLFFLFSQLFCSSFVFLG